MLNWQLSTYNTVRVSWVHMHAHTMQECTVEKAASI